MPWTIDAALADEAIERTERTNHRYSFWLKGIPTEIQVTLSINPERGGFDFHLSDLIHTPTQTEPYRPRHTWGDDEGYALHLAVTAITQSYREAIDAGFPPNVIWLVPNEHVIPSGLFGGDLSIGEVLAQLRRRLLDLTARNRLLNFRHSSTKTVQVVDTYLSVVYERLMENRTLTFLPVPNPAPDEYEGENRNQKPDVRAYAGKLGIKTSFELPAAPPDLPGTGGQKLRVLAYPEDTERLCRRLFKEARSAIEETGTNMLYLAFGFLEYYESDAADKPLLAPLIAVPVEIKKGPPDRHSRLPIYEVNYAGDEVAENLSLREKLRLEFSMVLPEFKEERGLEVYLSEVAEAVATRRRWKVSPSFR